jgi:leucine dehydrogenase
MEVFQELGQNGQEQVVFFYDKDTGLRSIIGIHNSVLGPTLGGCRMWKYRDEHEAFTDLLRLSRGMTYKSAVAGLNLGGGKGVIIGDPNSQKTPELLKAFGRAVETMGGRYVTTEDVGIGVPDVDIIRTTTQYAVGGSQAGGAGDPSRMTALGIFRGMIASVKHAGLADSLKGLTVAIQGVGNVGSRLCARLVAVGAKVLVSDIYPQKVERAVKEFGATAVSVDDIFSVDCDIFAPCALGAILNARTIPQLRCKIVAGAANNQLELDSDGVTLHERGILYVPDYAINAGGLINVAAELWGYDEQAVEAQVCQIESTIHTILSRSKAEGVLPLKVADSLAEERIERAKLSLKAAGEFCVRPAHELVDTHATKTIAKAPSPTAFPHPSTTVSLN